MTTLNIVYIENILKDWYKTNCINCLSNLTIDHSNHPTQSALKFKNAYPKIASHLVLRV